MAKRNTSGRSGARSSSSSSSRGSTGKKSFDPKPSGGKSFGGGTGKRPRKFGQDNTEGGDKRPRSSGPGSYRKSTTGDTGPRSGSPNRASGRDRKTPFQKDKPGFSPRGEKQFRKNDSEDTGRKRPYKKFDRKDSGDKAPFKREGSGFRNSESSTGLRRERPYKNTGDDAEKTPRAKKDFGSEPRKFSDKKSSTFVKRAASVTRKAAPDLDAPIQTGQIRLNKYISNSGVCSRREADELITMGVISVNGKTITELGYKVNPGDVVRHESKILKAERPIYILLNKPKGFLTTTSDPQERNTVMHLIGNAVKERIYPVGRLDRNTTGLLLLTNDGDLADKLMHPSYNAKKIYKAVLDRPLTKADAQQIMEGVKLEEGKAMVDDLAVISEDKRTVGLEIHIGWNRVVRRIFEALNYEVMKLDRSVYAGLDKKDLGRGEWRYLTKEELVRLKHYK